MAIRTIAVVGAGHGGFGAAADLALRGYAIRLYAPDEVRLAPVRKAGGIRISGAQNGFAKLDRVTSRIHDAVEGADLIMMVLPAVAFPKYARELAKVLTPQHIVFVDPGHTCGGMSFVHELRQAGYDDDVQTCETASITHGSRKKGSPETAANLGAADDGAEVFVAKYIENLGFSAFPGKHAQRLFELLQPVYPQIRLRSSVLETAFANVNAVFHPPGMILNAGWVEFTGGNFLFYNEGITEAVGRVTQAIDDERVAVARALGVPVRSFLDMFYEMGMTTAEAHASGSIHRACVESAPNRMAKSPTTLRHRYVDEDIGYGLVPMAGFGDLAGIETPAIDALVVMASLCTGVDYARTGMTLESLGIASMSPDDLKRYVWEGR
jgi:opine dehydrogenase